MQKLNLKAHAYYIARFVLGHIKILNLSLPWIGIMEERIQITPRQCVSSF